MLNSTIIAISGRSGCGNTTVSSLAAQQLGFTMINYTFRSLADDLGLTFQELSRLAELDDSYDRMLDRRQVELGRKGNCVLGSRLAVWLLEEAGLKVYLDASLETRAKRIMNREGDDYLQKLEETRDRDLRDARRYQRIYQIDTSDYSFVDLVIDTDTCDQYEAADRIVREYTSRYGSLHSGPKTV